MKNLVIFGSGIVIDISEIKSVYPALGNDRNIWLVKLKDTPATIELTADEHKKLLNAILDDKVQDK